MPSLARLRDKLRAARRRGDRVNLQENAARIQPVRRQLRPRLPGRARPRRQRCARPGASACSRRRSSSAPTSAIALVVRSARSTGTRREARGPRSSARWPSPRHASRQIVPLVTRSSPWTAALPDRRRHACRSPRVPAAPPAHRSARSRPRPALAHASRSSTPLEIAQRRAAHAGVGAGAGRRHDWQSSQDSTLDGNAKQAELVDRARVRRADGARALGRRREGAVGRGDEPRPARRTARHDWARRERRRRRSRDAARRTSSRPTLMPTDGIVLETAQRDRRERARPTPRRCARCTTGSSRTPIASPRCAAAASATSRRCSRPATWAASAATSTRCSSACARAAGVPARDIYGIRVAKSAFGYKELGAGIARHHARAALPRGSVARRPRLGRDGSGRRRQGDAPRNAGLAQGPEAPGRRAR